MRLVYITNSKKMESQHTTALLGLLIIVLVPVFFRGLSLELNLVAKGLHALAAAFATQKLIRKAKTQ